MKALKTAMFLLLTLALAWAFPAFGQSDRGSITGTVKDQNGGVVPNAKVTATNIDTGEVRKTTTGNEGAFTLSELKAASYRLTVEATGFKTSSLDKIQLGVQIIRRADVTLEAGAVSEKITVTSEAPVLQTDSPVQQLNVTERQVRELPLLVAAESGGRSPLAFIFLDSSVNPNGATSSGTNATNFRIMTVARLSRRILALCLISALAAVAGGRGATGLAQTPAAQRLKPNDQLLAEGVAALERGDDSTARDLLERALAGDPRSAEAHTYLGALADRAGDLAAAERHFAAASRLAPQSARARNNYGAILLRLDRRREAAAEFEVSLRLDPNQAKALVNLARIRFESGSPEGLRSADDLFRRAAALAPDVEIARALTVIALRRGDRARAADCYRAYATRVASATSDTPAAGARSDLGGALFEAGLLTEAEAELNAALTLDPANAETVLRLARVYLARKEIPAAGRALEAALARKVEAPAIYALLAVVYEKSGHIENAIPAMRIAIQLDPQSEKYRFQYGVLLTETNAPAAAVIRLNEALQSFPKSSRLHLAIGLANLKMDKNGEAAQAFNRAIELDPEFAQAYAYLGILRVAAGQYEEGVRCFEQALQRNPNIAVVHYLLADALLKQTDADAARIEKSLKRAIELDATYAPALLALGKLRAQAGRLPEAVAEFEQVIRLDPNLAEAYYQLGRALNRLKRTAEAQSALDTFKRLSDSQKQQEQDEQRDIVRRLADVIF